jgi:predicted ArsR family transcriptional regulator
VSPTAPDPRAVAGSVGVLGDESRWRLFSFIRRSRRAVTREEAAAKVGISRKLAAFHLDKMVAAGLLRARYEATGEATGEAPRVGRRPKVYEPVADDISVSIPGRQYRLLADLLLQTLLDERPARSRREVATRTAREHGLALGAEGRRPGAAERAGAAALPACMSVLEAHGYEPVLEGDREVRLRNCPFHPLAAQATDLVCGMNQAFLAGYLDGLQVSGVEAVLDPAPGECCVRLSATR